MAETLSLKKMDRVALITLEIPKKRNALSTKVVNEIREAMQDIEADNNIRAVVITGSAGAFCAGADISEVAPINKGIEFYPWVRNLQKLLLEIEEMGKPVIAAVNGLAMGGGLELSIACDMRIAAESAVFAVPEINIGVLPAGGGMSRLPRLVGMAVTKEMIFTGRRVAAEEALKIGLVNKVVPDDQVLDEAIKMAGLIASKPPITIAVGKATVHKTAEADIYTAAKMEAHAIALVFDTEDRKEGMQAFLEKRAPVFKGK